MRQATVTVVARFPDDTPNATIENWFHDFGIPTGAIEQIRAGQRYQETSTKPQLHRTMTATLELRR